MYRLSKLCILVITVYFICYFVVQNFYGILETRSTKDIQTHDISSENEKEKMLTHVFEEKKDKNGNLIEIGITVCKEDKERLFELVPEGWILDKTLYNSSEFNMLIYSKPVAPAVGIGDRFRVFIEKHPIGNSAPRYYFENNYLLLSKLYESEERIHSLAIFFEATDDPSRTMEEAKIVANEFIPTDSVLVNEFNHKRFPVKIMEYRSENYAKFFSNPGSEGTFFVSLYYDNHQDVVSEVHIGPDLNLSD